MRLKMSRQGGSCQKLRNYSTFIERMQKRDTCSKCVIFHCLWLSFLFLFFRFCTSPTGRHGWPIFTMYTSNDAFSCKEVPFGVSMMNFHIYPRFSPKIWKFALWPMATSNGNNSATLKIEARCLYHIGGSGVGQFSGVDEICLRPTPVTMATNWRFLSAKLAKTRLIH